MAAGLLLFTACARSNNTLWSEFQTPADPRGWDPLESLEFKPLPLDSAFASEPMDMILTLRHTDNTDVDRLWIKMEQSSGVKVILTDTIEVPLVGQDEKWIGKGSYGIYTVSVPARCNFRLPGLYSVALTPLSSKNVIKGISKVGLSLEQHSAGNGTKQ